MGNKTYRVGIVGLRGIAAGPAKSRTKAGALGVNNDDPPYPLNRQLVTSHAACLALMPEATVVAYCDMEQELLDQFKSNWDGRWPDAKPYLDFNKMIDEANLDILSVCTGDATHGNLVVRAAESGVKAIMCEKPLATSMEDANRMLKACADNGVPLSVGHTRRWRKMYHTVRESIRAGSIGPIDTIVASHWGARAMLFRNGTHIIDGIGFFAESPPKQVWAKLEDGFDDWDVYKGVGGKDPASEPGASGFVIHENGIRSFYVGSKNSVVPGSTLQITGPKGQIEFQMNGGVAKLLTKAPDGETLTQELIPDDYQSEYYVAAYEELINLVENGGEGVGTGKHGRWVVQIMTGFLNSHQAGSTLVDVPQ